MVLLSKPDAMGAFDGVRWSTVEEDVLFHVQRYQLGEAGKMFRSFVGSKPKDFRLISRGASPLEIAAADSLEEIQVDADALRQFMVGVAPEQGATVPTPVRQALQEGASRVQSERASDENNQESGATALSQWTSPELRTQLEPWAVSLLENADRMRYVCYALKVASSLGAEGATGGFAGEEILSLSFVGVDALLVSTWMNWFLNSLTDNSPGSNVIKQVVRLDFIGGPEAVLERVDAICETMSPEEAEDVTKMAMMLKKRIAVVVGDIVALMVPNDASVTGVVITELLIRLQPTDAEDMLRRLMDLYSLVPAGHRATLENSDQLRALLDAANRRLRTAILEEYDMPASKKLQRAACRNAKFIGARILLAGTPLGPALAAMHVADLVRTTGCVANTGRESCDQVFNILGENMPGIVDTIQRAMGMSFGLLVLLARCADRANSADGPPVVQGRQQ